MHIVNLEDAAGIVTELGVPVHGAPATGLGLHSNGHLGADILHVPAGKQFPVHTHPGDHLLLCLVGEGTISVGEETFNVRPGDFYMVDGMVPHAVGAGGTDHTLVAIGSPHKPVDSPERMQWTDWDGEKVTNPIFAKPKPAWVTLKHDFSPNEIRDLQDAMNKAAAAGGRVTLLPPGSKTEAPPE